MSADAPLLALFRAIVAHDEGAAARLLGASPSLATAALGAGATRQAAKQFFFDEIRHYAYADPRPSQASRGSGPVIVMGAPGM